MKSTILFLLSATLLFSCQDETIVPAEEKKVPVDTSKVIDKDTLQNKDTIPMVVKPDTIQFTLYINYTQSVDSCKTFRVLSDSLEVCNKELCDAGISPCALTITFPVVCSTHKLRAEVSGETVFFEKNIDFIASKKFGYMNYYGQSKTFSFYLSETGGID